MKKVKYYKVNNKKYIFCDVKYKNHYKIKFENFLNVFTSYILILIKNLYTDFYHHIVINYIPCFIPLFLLLSLSPSISFISSFFLFFLP